MNTLAVSLLLGLFLALVGFIIWLAQQLIAHKGKELFLEQDNSKLKQQYCTAKQEIANLQKQISQYTDKEKLLSDYPPDAKATIRREKATGRPVCNICIQQEKPIISFLEKYEGYWFCRKCDKAYS